MTFFFLYTPLVFENRELQRHYALLRNTDRKRLKEFDIKERLEVKDGEWVMVAERVLLATSEKSPSDGA